MDWGALVISLIITVVVYLLVPVILALSKKKYPQKRIKWIVIVNCVVCWLILQVLTIELTGESHTSAAVFIWGAVGYAILRKFCIKTEEQEEFEAAAPPDVSKSTPKADDTVSTEAQIFTAPPDFTSLSSPQELDKVVPPAKKKRRKPVLIVIILLAVAVGVVVFFSLNGAKNSMSISDAANSVLYLEIFDDTDNMIGTASGFVIEDGNTLITNYHVIDGAYRIIAYTPKGERSFEVHTVLAYDQRADLAILKCEENTGIRPLILANSDEVKQGDEVYAVGYPLGVANTLSNGIVSSRYLDENKIDTIQITAAVSSGSSGGALLNKNGQVIGVVCASYHNGQNLNIAIPCSYVQNLLSDESSSPISVEKLYSIKYPDEYYVGVRTISISPLDYKSANPRQAAKEAAIKIYEEWLAGEATETSLMSIMDQYGAEQGGGQLYIILPGDFIEEIDEWCFDQVREPGDISIIENLYGYSICFFSGKIIKSDTASDSLQRKAAAQALEVDRKEGPGAYGGSDWLNRKLS